MRAEFPGGEFGGDGELAGGSAAEADSQRDVAVADESDILDEQSGHAFALVVRGFGIVPEAREVGGQLLDFLALDLVEPSAVDLAAAFEVIEGFLPLGESGVPIGFEFGGDQAVVGVGAQEASAGEVGFLGGALRPAGAEGIGFVGARHDFVLNPHCGLEGERRDEFDQQISDRSVDARSGGPLAGGGRGLELFPLAEVIGEQPGRGGRGNARSCAGRRHRRRRVPVAAPVPRAGGAGGRRRRPPRSPRGAAGWPRTAPRRCSRDGRR